MPAYGIPVCGKELFTSAVLVCWTSITPIIASITKTGNYKFLMEYYINLLHIAHINVNDMKSLKSTLFFLAIALKRLYSFLEVFECYWKFHVELLQSQDKIALDLAGF